jgi:hypothetical protein
MMESSKLIHLQITSCGYKLEVHAPVEYNLTSKDQVQLQTQGWYSLPQYSNHSEVVISFCRLLDNL